MTVIYREAPRRVARVWHALGRFSLRRYASVRGARGAAAFLGRLVVRGRARADSAGALSTSASLAWLSCSASRRISARAAPRSLAARSARMRSASRVSSTALMRALVAAVSCSSGRWWSARMRAVSSAAEGATVIQSRSGRTACPEVTVELAQGQLAEDGVLCVEFQSGKTNGIMVPKPGETKTSVDRKQDSIVIREFLRNEDAALIG